MIFFLAKTPHLLFAPIIILKKIEFLPYIWLNTGKIDPWVVDLSSRIQINMFEEHPPPPPPAEIT